MKRAPTSLRSALALLTLASVLAACASEPERPLLKADNLVFRLGAKPTGVEVRIESGFFPSGGHDLVAEVEGGPPKPEDLKQGITILLKGVRAPLDAKGAAAPAYATLLLPVGPVDGVVWSLLFKSLSEGASPRLDAYTVEHRAGAWRFSRTQGGFSRFEAQGSY